MDPRHTYVLLFGAVFFVFVMIVGIMRARREKEKGFYFVTMAVAFLMVLVVVSLFLNQSALAMIFMASAFVVAVASLPSLIKYIERKMKEAPTRVVLSAPLRLRKFYTTTEWLKLAHRWGVGKALFVVWLYVTLTIGGVLFALNLWLKFMSTAFIFWYITYSTGSLILLNYIFKSALKEKN